MKYKEELIEKVRKGEAQIQVDNNDEWTNLVNYIFPNRKTKYVTNNYYASYSDESGFNARSVAFPNLPIIHAKDFIIQEPEVNWVEVRDNDEQEWEKLIFLADLGSQVDYRYRVVAKPDTELYISGKSKIRSVPFLQMRPIPQPEPLTHKQIEELIGKPFKYVEE